MIIILICWIKIYSGSRVLRPGNPMVKLQGRGYSEYLKVHSLAPTNCKNTLQIMPPSIRMSVRSSLIPPPPRNFANSQLCSTSDAKNETHLVLAPTLTQKFEHSLEQPLSIDHLHASMYKPLSSSSLTQLNKLLLSRASSIQTSLVFLGKMILERCTVRSAPALLPALLA